ncbi:MAG: MvaI/BcnI family restriction endonuclease [Ekhidna sp.]|nr:MvaI/BcnI family restriction endonuclease [Ekhidna sp.]
MNLKEIQQRLEDLKGRGFISTHRRGPTGIGHTLEQELQLDENNLAIPDLGGRVELKANRKKSGSMVTLFTFNRSVWQMSQREVIETFGYIDDKGRRSLYSTVFHSSPNPQGLEIQIDRGNHQVHLCHKNQMLGTWSVFTIVGKFVTKLERLIVVFADNRISEETGKEEFHFNEAYLLDKPDPDNFLDAFEKGLIAMDVRMHLKPTGALRNHGTGFRIDERNIPNLYEHREQIIFV